MATSALRGYLGRHRVWVALLASLALAVLLARPALRGLGGFLIRTDPVVHADAAVVLFHGGEVYLRIEEAARLYREGAVDCIVINGGRRPPVVKDWESRGLVRDWRWQDEFLPLFPFFGVPAEKVVVVTAEEAYDTGSEARLVGKALRSMELRSLIVTTSNYHTRRAGTIWRGLWGKEFEIRVHGAEGAFDPSRWWTDGRQAKILLSEYGAWIFLLWKGDFSGG